MNAMRNITIIYPTLCEKIITFRLTFLLPEILSLRFFEPQQIRLGLIALIQISVSLQKVSPYHQNHIQSRWKRQRRWIESP